MVSYQLGGSICCDSASETPINLASDVNYLENIALLRAAALNASGDSVVIVGGYYAPGDGGGGLYVWEPTAAAADNGGTIINQAGNIGPGRWVLQNFGQAISIKQFGAVIDGATDDTLTINAALAAVDDLIVPAGTSFIAGTLNMLRSGQKFHGVSPNPADAGSNLVFGPGSADCIALGDISGIVRSWQQVYDLNLNCAQRTGITGRPNTALAPSTALTCCAVAVYFGSRAQISRLNIFFAWNGVMDYCGANIELDSVNFTNTRGDFNELHFGSAAMRCTFASSKEMNYGALPDITLATSAGVGVGSVIPMASTAGLSTGWSVSGYGSAIAAGPVIVTAITPGVSITINQNITGLLASGTNLTFSNSVIGLWLGSYFTNFKGNALRATNAAIAMQTDDGAALTGSAPLDVWIYSLSGSSLGVGNKINLQAGTDINLTELHINGAQGATSGRGVFFGPNAANLRIVGGEIALHALAGIDLEGDGTQLIGLIIGQNSQAGAQAFDGVTIAATASRIQISDCQIGVLIATGGQQRYGVNNAGAPASSVLLDGNDLRGNGIGAVNDPELFTLGTNQGLSTGAGAVLDNNAEYLIANLATTPLRARAFLMDDLIRALEAAGVWALTDLCFSFAASDRPTSLTNWKLPGAGTTNPQALGVNNPTFAVDGGYTTDGASSYVDLGVAPLGLTNYSLNSAGIFVWSSTDVEDTASVDIGTAVAGSNIFINGRNASGNMLTNANASTQVSETVANSSGFYGWSRNNAASYKTYKGNAALATHAIASTTIPAGDLWALHSQGAGFSARELSFVWVGGGLSDAQALALYNAVNAYMTAV